MKKEELEALSVKELKDKCKELGLTNYSRLSADELVQLLLNQTLIDETDELDELLDSPDEQPDEQPNDNESGPDEQPDESGPDEQPNDNDSGPDEQPDESGPDEQPNESGPDEQSNDNESGPDELLEELGPEQTELVTFRKNIKGAFGFNGQTFTGSTFDLTVEEAAHGKIKNAIKNGLIKLK
jgi:hypothetical protein